MHMQTTHLPSPAPGASTVESAPPAVSEDMFSTLINLAGRQRMLSQRIVLHAVLASLGRDDAADLAQEALGQFKNHHGLLVNGGGPGALPGLFSESLRSTYFGAPQADAKVREFVALAERALDAIKADGRHAPAALTALVEQANPLLDLLNEVTAVYEKESKAHATAMKRQAIDLLSDIRSIARTARLVAFNARVVAARAGSAGREFTAVASVMSDVTDEIDRLAVKALDRPD